MVDFKAKLMTDISINCESLGINYCAPILSIGAVQFNRKSGAIGKEFYREIRMSSAIKHAERGIDPGTIYWWIKQQPALAAQMFDDSDVARERKVVIQQALFDLADFVRGSSAPLVWFNGPLQDGAWLEHAFANQAVGLSHPWVFRNVRDVRTVRDCAMDVGFDYHKIPFKGTQHNALDDAKYQARVVSDCLAAIRGGPRLAHPEDDDEI